MLESSSSEGGEESERKKIENGKFSPDGNTTKLAKHASADFNLLFTGKQFSLLPFAFKRNVYHDENPSNRNRKSLELNLTKQRKKKANKERNERKKINLQVIQTKEKN